MKLFTKEIEKKLQEQYACGAELDQDVIVKIFNPYSAWTWYIMNQDPQDPDYLWAIVKGFEIEMGSVSKADLENLLVPPLNLPLERDLYFDPIPAQEVWNELQKGGGMKEERQNEIKELRKSNGLAIDKEGPEVEY